MSRARKLGYAGLVLLGFVLLGEAGLRLLDALRGKTRASHLELRAPRFAYHPSLGHALVPGYRSPPSGRKVTVNSLGFRGAEVALPKPPGTFRVLCLGGSTTFGALLEDDQTWPAALERRLRTRFPGRAIEVVNGGADGYSSAESLIQLALRGVDLAPDLVIVYDGINDLRPSWLAGYRADYSHVPRLFGAALLEAELRRYGRARGRIGALLERSVLFLVLRNRLERAGEARPGLRLDDRRVERAPEPLPSVAAFRRNLESLVAVARAHGSQVLLATFALLPERSWSAERKRELLARVNPYYAPPRELDELIAGVEALADVTREVGRATAAPIVDLARLLPHDERLFRDECHFTPAGAEAVAERVAEAVARKWLTE